MDVWVVEIQGLDVLDGWTSGWVMAVMFGCGGIWGIRDG